MGILEEDIARVRAATDFVGLASEHMALKRVGTRLVGLCPFHVEKSPSLSINAQDGLYYCFGCGAKGDVITFVREIEHLDFVEAVEKLAGRAGITLRYDNEATSQDHQRRTRIYETLSAALAWYHQRLLSGPDAAAARAYLRRERGYDGEVVRRYQLGWAPDGWDQLVRSLGVPTRALVDAGLAYVNDSGRYNDFFRGRILFPIFEAGGKPVGAGGRMLPGGRPPKYKNTSGTAVYDKSQILYGLNWAKTAVVDLGQVVVCEGYTDVIGLHEAGIREAVATCGTALADGHIRRLTNFARRIVLAYDADAAGQAAADRFYEWERRYEVDIRVAALPAGADPADLARRDPDGLRRAIGEARPYLAFQIERLLGRADMATAEGRVRAATAAMELITAHPNELVRDQYLMEVADRCRVDPGRLRSLAQPTTAGRPRPAGSVRGASVGADHVDRPQPVAVNGAELEALRLAVHRPAELAERLQRPLFAHPLARGAFSALAGAPTLHDAIAGADLQTADLLQRLAVEEADADPDDVLTRLVERAGRRGLDELQVEARHADDPAVYVPTITWLKRALETLRSGEEGDRNAAQNAQQHLVDWIVARSEAEDQQHRGADPDGCG